jgi:hypothetical protein
MAGRVFQEYRKRGSDPEPSDHERQPDELPLLQNASD